MSRIRTANTLLTLTTLVCLAVPSHAAPPAVDPYAAGMQQVQRAVAAGDLPRAERTVGELSRRYGSNVELLSMRGRILFWQKRYAESIAAFQAALRVKHDKALAAEMARVKTAQKLDEADRLTAAKKVDQAEKMLLQLFEGGREPYPSGLRLARLRLQKGDAAGANQVLTEMLRLYPSERDLVLLKAQALLLAGVPKEALEFLASRQETARDAELLALRARAQLRLERFAEALGSFDASLSLADRPEVRLERRRAETAELLRRADRLAAEGKESEAVHLLSAPFDRGEDRYDTGSRLAALNSRSGNPREAARIYFLLKKEYPEDRDFPLLGAKSLADAGETETALALLDDLGKQGEDPQASLLRARILSGKGSLDKAYVEYRRALRLGVPSAGIAAEMAYVEEGADYARAATLVAVGDRAQADPLLEKISASGGAYGDQARLLKLRLLIADGRGDEAARLGSKLHEGRPDDAAISLLYAEALLLCGETSRAEELLQGGSAPAAEELLYRARGNWVKLQGAGYGYSGGRQSEESFGVALSQRFRDFTGVVGASRTSRFGESDDQLTLDLYSRKRGDERFYGSLSFSLSPGGRFLPRNSLGAELAGTFGPFELSGGYNRLNFRDTHADVASGGVLWYLPATELSLGEKVYFAPGHGTATSVTTLRWEASRRVTAFTSVAAGNAGERPSRQEDFRRYGTYALRGGAEYRFSPSYSFGGEGGYESRRGLYDRYGVSFFVKYWWP